MRPMTWSGAGLVAVLASAALASAAQAQPSWQCSASAVSSSLAGNPGANPVVASGNPCVSNATGLDNLPSPLGVPADAVSARTSSATTVANPENEIAARQAVGRHRPRREPRRPAPARRGDDDARRPRRQRAGLRHLRRGLARARRLQRGHRPDHRRPGGPDRAGRAAARAAARAAGRRRRPEVRRAGAHRQLAGDQRAAPEGALRGRHARARGHRRRGERRLQRQGLRPDGPDPDRARQLQRRQQRQRRQRLGQQRRQPHACWPTACAAAPAAS